MPHQNTAERFSNLAATLGENADIVICFPEEDPTLVNADIFLLEEEMPLVTQRLLASENPPLIVFPKEGICEKHIRYLPDFSRQFPKLLKELPQNFKTVCFTHKNECYSYNQKDILFLTESKNLTVHFRQGSRMIFHQSLKKIAKQLSPQLFFPVGEEFMINADYVCEITKDAVRLQNGQNIPFNSAMAEQVHNAFFKTKYLSN